MMIEVTVKTLDSKNHSFTVSEELTVKEFKEEISPRVSIPAVEQRLIFRGRVLQDDKKIQEYNVSNNTIHLVQRPNQPGGTSSQNDEPPRNPSGASGEDRFNMEGGGGGIIITAVGEQSVNATPTGGRRNSAAMRLQTGNEMINRASTLLQRLEEDDEISQATSQVDNASNSNEQEPEILDIPGLDVSSMEVDADDPASFGRMISQVANAASAAAVMSSVRAMNSQGTPDSGSNSENVPRGDGQQASQNSVNVENVSGVPSATPGSGPGARRADAPRLREMAIALQDLLALNERLTPFLHFVQRILRDNQSYSSEAGELRSVQYAFDTVSSIMHYLAHSYHAYSDLICDFSTTPDTRRLSAPATILVEQSTVVRATIPIAVPASFGTSPSSPFQQQSAPQQQQAQESASENQTGSSASPQNVPSSPSMQRSSFPRNNSPLNLPPSNVNINAHNVAGNPGISINIQSNGIPDLASILGPAFAGVAGGAGGGAGMLPFLSLGGLQANLRQQQQAQQRPQAQQNNSSSGQPHWTAAAMGNNSSSRNNESAQQQSQLNANANAGAGGIAGMGNFQQNLRNELIRPPLDVLLNCHSHHSNRNRVRRPADLHQHVNVARDNSSSAAIERSHDFFGSLVEIIRYSTWLEILQPHLKDIIQNYLMRGRDIKNSLHIKTCARSLAKKLMPLFQSVTDTISTKNEKVAYQETFSEFATKFYFKLLSLVVSSGPTRQFRTSLLLLWEESMLNLFTIFRHGFPNNNRVPEIFAKALVDEYFTGMPIVFRSYAKDRLAGYFITFSSTVDTKVTTPESTGLIFKTDDDSWDEGSSSVTRKVASPFTSNSSLPSTSHTKPTATNAIGSQPSTSSSVVSEQPALSHSITVGAGSVSSSTPSLPPKAVKVTTPEVDSMETDIDDLVDQIPQGPKNEDPILTLPPEWRETVRHDIHRQLGMPDQPPPSPGYSTLFHRKH